MVLLLISIVKYPHSLESGISLSKSRLSLKNERRLLGYLQQRNKNTQKDKKCAKKYSRMRKAYFFKKHGNIQTPLPIQHTCCTASSAHLLLIAQHKKARFSHKRILKKTALYFVHDYFLSSSL